MSAADVDEALDNCLAQLDRTAAWLRSLPLARFGRDGGAVARQARGLIGQVHSVVLDMCQSLAGQAGQVGQAGQAGQGDGSAQAWEEADCPPSDAVPDLLGVHALGEQLAVHAGDLNRCGHTCVSAGVAISVAELNDVAAAALRLRSGA